VNALGKCARRRWFVAALTEQRASSGMCRTLYQIPGAAEAGRKSWWRKTFACTGLFHQFRHRGPPNVAIKDGAQYGMRSTKRSPHDPDVRRVFSRALHRGDYGIGRGKDGQRAFGPLMPGVQASAMGTTHRRPARGDSLGDSRAVMMRTYSGGRRIPPATGCLPQGSAARTVRRDRRAFGGWTRLQCGMGRTGTAFCRMKWAGVTPVISCWWPRASAGGLSIGRAAGDRERQQAG